MAKFLIEVPHDEDPGECARAVQFFLRTGSQFMARADWGCSDGVHKAFIIVDAESKEAAREVIPRIFHSQATIVQLNKFTIEEMDRISRKRG